IPALDWMNDCRLVVVDPLISFIGNDAWHRGRLQELLNRMGRHAKKRHFAFLGVAHLGKRASAAAVNRVVGALSFVASGGSVWGVVRDPEDRDARLLLPVKSNVAEANEGLRFRFVKVDGTQAPRIEWDEEPVMMSFEAASGRRMSASERQYWDRVNYVAER